jgi:hypothetical protein
MQITEMYQSCCDVHFDMIWRDATESTLVKTKIELEARKTATVLWK